MSDERDWEAEFAAITANWNPHEETGPTLTSDRNDIREAPQQETTRRQPAARPISLQRDARTHPGVQRFDGELFGQQPASEDDAPFIPPTPAPLNWSDPSLVIMLAALVIGPMWLGFLLFWNRDSSPLAWGSAAGITLLGFVLAVARQPRSREDQPNDDDGARV